MKPSCIQQADGLLRGQQNNPSAHAEQIRARVFKSYSSGEGLAQLAVDLLTVAVFLLIVAIAIGIVLSPFAMIAVCFYG